MAFSEFELKKHEKEVSAFIEKRRPPVHVRNEVDLSFRIENQSVVIFEIRAGWRNPAEKIEQLVAKSTYVKSQNVWKVYWLQQDLKWHLYEPVSEAKTLAGFLSVVDQDTHCCFWG
ncbi:DUF3024 domain-containing protein [Photobacterium minamisatsumaniensis]|uniref:DUF3024 domain-containing protein n=1 Tax=Photobacterium minamisatsumaniensis TaxID=2910233 RepID=UPI003D10ABB3